MNMVGENVKLRWSEVLAPSCQKSKYQMAYPCHEMCTSVSKDIASLGGHRENNRSKPEVKSILQ